MKGVKKMGTIGYQQTLAKAKEVREETDIKKVASLLATKEWVVVAVSLATGKSTTYALIRI